MKRLTTLLSLVIFCTLIYAQQPPTSGGPDNFGYTFNNSNHSSGPTYSWFDISTIGTPVVGLSDDNFVGPFSITGFAYYTTNPTQYWIGSNGYISFNPVNIASSAASFPIIPTSGGPNDFIAPFLSDLTFGGASTNPGMVYRYDQGDTVCISFENVPFWVNNGNQYGGDNSFQVILNRADSSITFNYKKQLGTPDPVYQQNYISIGIENGTGSDGLQYYRGDTTALTFTSVKYDYPNIIQPITDASVDWVDNDRNAAKFIATNGSFTPIANIKNTGNQNIMSPITISYLIQNSTGSVLSLGSTSLASLNNGQDTTLSLGASYSPANAGKYIITTYISGITNDNTPSNDTSSMFYIAVDTTTITQDLDYTDGINTAGSIGWTGGNGGVAIYIEPPYYPARILSSNFFITSTGTPPVGFYSKIYDDNSRTTIQGNLLDSALIPQNLITINTYHKHVLNQNLIINSGGVYLLWLMEGDGINLGRAANSPASRNTYEVLFGTWSDYRDSDSEDFLMGLEIEPVAVGINEDAENSILHVYPNPATDHVWIETNKTPNINNLNIYNVEGKQVEAKILVFDKKIQVLKGNLSEGTYFLRHENSSTRIIFTN